MPDPKQPIRIQTAAYDEETKRLVVTFTNGQRFEREDVTRARYERLMNADANPKVSTFGYWRRYFKAK